MNFKVGNIVIGILYERPDGSIIKTYGFDCMNKIISYFDETLEHGYSASLEEFETWKPRYDLNDFPNAKDPILPYEFDLIWDIKYTSQLKRELENNHPDKEEIIEYMKKSGISI